VPERRPLISHGSLLPSSSSFSFYHVQQYKPPSRNIISAAGAKPTCHPYQLRNWPLLSPQELNRIFVRSDRLNSEAIVEFVRALCTVAREELRTPGAPRVYSLTKIVEIAHFNMTRIRCAYVSVSPAPLYTVCAHQGCSSRMQWNAALAC